MKSLSDSLPFVSSDSSDQNSEESETEDGFYTVEIEKVDEDGEPYTEEELRFNPGALSVGEEIGSDVKRQADSNTLETLHEDPDSDFDETEFFRDDDGNITVTTRYDLEKQVPNEKKDLFEEVERYWVNEPYVFISIFRSVQDNEVKYYAIEPYLTDFEETTRKFIQSKLRDRINYNEDIKIGENSQESLEDVVASETQELLEYYEYYSPEDSEGENFVSKIREYAPEQLAKYLDEEHDHEEATSGERQARPESAILKEDEELSDYQLDKVLYYLHRDYTGYSKIDPIKHDINVEDISCDGYNMPVFVYHSGYEQIITNIYHGEQELDNFVVDLAKRSNQAITKKDPQVDITLPDGSRGQLTYGDKVSDHGTNYTIRQFKDVPFTPTDLINWKTFSLEQMAFLWLCIQNHKSLIFAGGTASGKTTSLNAVSLFIPSSAKIVSIEDTREVELPQRNWIASVTRSSFSEDEKGGIDEFDLLEAALRQRPDYIVMGEIRGEEGRTLFQVMSTGHTTYTTFHASNPSEVLKRFTTEPINVSKTMFTALDLISIQAATRVDGKKVRRNKSLTEISSYDPENDEINVQDVYQWQAETDSFVRPGDSNIIEDIKFDRGWDDETLNHQLEQRQVLLAYLIYNGLKNYSQVAATFQAFMTDPDTVLTLIAEDKLEKALEDLKKMESVQIQVDAEDEENTPRPDPSDDIKKECKRILDNAEEWLEEYKGNEIRLQSFVEANTQQAEEIEVDPDEPTAIDETQNELLAELTEEFETKETTDPEIEVVS